MKFRKFLIVLALSATGCYQVSDSLGDYRRGGAATPMEFYMPGDPILDDYSQVSDNDHRLAQYGETKRRISPQRVKDHDNQWVSSQPEDRYTIEISRNAKASVVANTLHTAPKMQRMAEVKTADGYIGVYGSYATRGEAEAAAQGLPSALKAQASIKSWRSIKEGQF